MSSRVTPFHEATVSPEHGWLSRKVSNVVAIPVRNERERIVTCLKALASQAGEMDGLGILLFLNNCTDDTLRCIEAWSSQSPWPIRIVMRDSDTASAGWARREAMEAGASWLEEAGAGDGLVLTTDADSRVPPDWVFRNRFLIAGGADAVAGRFAFDPDETVLLPPALRHRQRLVATYEALLAEIEARLDPRRGNPWPWHWTKSGASIAVTLAAYRQVGGIPRVQNGEDGAFIDLLHANGFVVRHAPDIVVTTSSRLDGRASGGTAATLKRWCDDQNSPCDARLERVPAFVLGLLRRRMRGRLWEAVQTSSVTSRLRPRELPSQIRYARFLLSIIRLRGSRPGGRRPFVVGTPGDMPRRLSMP